MLIYLLYCPQSGKGYVGQTVHTLEERWTQHCKKALKVRKHAIHAAIRKYGADAFEKSVLQTVETLDDLNRCEQEQIARLNTLAPNGYNLTTGGERTVYSEESKLKMSEAQKGKHPSPETLAKLRTVNLGRKFGPCPPEVRAKIGAANRGRKLSPEHVAKMKTFTHSPESRAKMSASHTGKKASPETIVALRAGHSNVSPETRAKMSAAHLGQKHSLESRAKMRAARRRRAGVVS